MKPRGYWTKSRCAELVHAYTDLKTFRAEQGSAYTTMKRNGWLGLCSVLNRNNQRNSYEQCESAAKQCTSRSEFERRFQSEYNSAIRFGYMDTVCKHMKPKNNSYIDEELLKIASRYNNKSEFRKFDGSAYAICHQRKLIDIACKHMQIVRKRWDSETILRIAQQYNTRKEFRFGEPKAYDAAKRLGITSLAFSHMKESISGYDQTIRGYLYILKSTSGHMKIGISNIPHTRHQNLARNTPFDFSVAYICGWDDGRIAKELESHLHSLYISAKFSGFDGHSEWFMWDDRIFYDIYRRVMRER